MMEVSITYNVTPTPYAQLGRYTTIQNIVRTLQENSENFDNAY